MSQHLTFYLAVNKAGLVNSIADILNEMLISKPIIKVFSSYQELRESIQDGFPDVLFISSELPFMAHSELIRIIAEFRGPIIVFGKKGSGIPTLKKPLQQYLELPYQKEKLTSVLRVFSNRVKELSIKGLGGPGDIVDGIISLPTFSGSIDIPLGNIIYIKSEGQNSILMTTSEERHMILYTIKSLRRILPSNGFKKYGKKYLINLTWIKEIIPIKGVFIYLNNRNRLWINEKG